MRDQPSRHGHGAREYVRDLLRSRTRLTQRQNLIQARDIGFGVEPVTGIGALGRTR